MIATLPMYDWPEIRWATDALWAALAQALGERGVSAPGALTRDQPAEASWRHPELLLGQTCGYPFVNLLGCHVQLVGTPAYRAPGCEGAFYRSYALVREDCQATGLADLRGSHAVYNDRHSQSGYSALRAMIAPLASGGLFFETVSESGSHADSMANVADGRADLCAVDCVCWALAKRHRPRLANRLRVLSEGPVAPGLPLVTASRTAAGVIAKLRETLRAVLNDPRNEDIRDALLLEDLAVLDERAYDRITDIEADAVALGYPLLN